MRNQNFSPFWGRSIGARFGYLEAQRDFDPEVVVNLLKYGNHDGNVLYVVRQRMVREVCAEIASSFDKIVSNGTTSRPDDGYVLTKQIGATQFAKSGTSCVRAVSENVSVNLDLLENISNGDVNGLVMNRELETSLLSHGIHFGSARYKGASAAFFVVRQWLDNGKMLMERRYASMAAGRPGNSFERLRKIFRICLHAFLCLSVDC
ncbi:hypothetical protein [Nguyenibacter sp. L1]|uniref:hypothetical protein n=1 Tax=Nguyenibacter sp. L1 TaxID=3049350 RepID=UPI002B47EAAD|nr:hypothetical protein [Nguyenibacter sp. L1]WRH86681.1 hypothetical protein QN315_11710 [Nguyenibacter sp. L1]